MDPCARAGSGCCSIPRLCSGPAQDRAPGQAGLRESSLCSSSSSAGIQVPAPLLVPPDKAIRDIRDVLTKHPPVCFPCAVINCDDYFLEQRLGPALCLGTGVNQGCEEELGQQQLWEALLLQHRRSRGISWDSKQRISMGGSLRVLTLVQSPFPFFFPCLFCGLCLIKAPFCVLLSLLGCITNNLVLFSFICS